MLYYGTPYVIRGSEDTLQTLRIDVFTTNTFFLRSVTDTCCINQEREGTTMWHVLY
jgi:hypothetical protein